MMPRDRGVMKGAPPLRYVTGDATAPQCDGPAIIAHACNDIGAWGSGFVLAVSARWPEPEDAYRSWFREPLQGALPQLGWTQFVPVGEGVQVANMIAQHGTVSSPAGDGRPPVRYRALSGCLGTVGEEALASGSSVHMPRIGCGLGGGRWDLVEPIIEWSLCRKGVLVTVYDLPDSPWAKARRPLCPPEWQ